MAGWSNDIAERGDCCAVVSVPSDQLKSSDPSMLSLSAGVVETLFGLLLVVIGCAWLAPGLLLALIVILLGASSGQRSVIGAGLGFLVIFIAAYFYGIQITMLQKSATLVATGIVILLARWIILRIVPEASADE